MSFSSIQRGIRHFKSGEGYIPYQTHRRMGFLTRKAHCLSDPICDPNERARLVKITKNGDKVFYLKKNKVFRIAHGIVNTTEDKIVGFTKKTSVIRKYRCTGCNKIFSEDKIEKTDYPTSKICPTCGAVNSIIMIRMSRKFYETMTKRYDHK